MFNRFKGTLTCIIAVSLGITACGNNREDISNKKMQLLSIFPLRVLQVSLI